MPIALQIPTGFTIAVLVIIAIPVLFFGLAFVVGCFEKQVVRMFEFAPIGEFPAYTSAMRDVANLHGFRQVSTGIHTKFREKIVASLLISADSSILAIIGEGALLGLKAKKTILLSRFRGGNILVTLDESGTAELDPLTTRQFLMNADFQELLEQHQATMCSMPPVEPFGTNPSWKDVDTLYRQRSDRIVAAGLAQYVDPRREFFRYTIWGSFRSSVVNGVWQILRPTNHYRNTIKRPGT